MKISLFCIILVVVLLFLENRSKNLKAEAPVSTVAFDSKIGGLSIDYVNYLSKHDLVYTNPINDLKNGVPFANGKVGALISNVNDLTMQVSNVDGSPYSQISAGYVKLSTTPKMLNIDEKFEARLALYDGMVVEKFGGTTTVTIFADPDSELMGIHVEDSRPFVTNITLDLSWPECMAGNDKTSAWITRTTAEGFGMTLASRVDGASFTTAILNNTTVRLNITPSKSYTIWIACPSKLNSANNNSNLQSQTLLSDATNSGYVKIKNKFNLWWHNFWESSFVQYSNNTDGDYIENLYYLSTYLIAGAGRGKYGFHFMNGVYLDKETPRSWSNVWYQLNGRCIYSGLMASNHIELMDPFFNFYFNNLSKYKAQTMARKKINGVFVPDISSFSGDDGGNQNIQTGLKYNVGAELGVSMFLRYKYTNDIKWLADSAYPFMKEAAIFYKEFFKWDGKYFNAEHTNALETYHDIRNSVVDIAAMRSFLPMVIEASVILNLDAAQRAEWQNLLNKLAPFNVVNNEYYPSDAKTPLVAYNYENPSLEMVWPYGVSGLHTIDLPISINTWKNRRCSQFTNSTADWGGPQINNVCSWSPDAIQAARLGLGNESYAYLKASIIHAQTRLNGLCDDGNGVFETNGNVITSINESLLQSYDGRINVFPATPTNEPTFKAKFSLLAKGGFLVSSESENNETKYVGIKSLYGNTVVIDNPWKKEEFQVRRVSDNVILTTTKNDFVSFETIAKEVYIVERTKILLSSFKFETLKGIKNKAQKSLLGNGGYGENNISRYLGKGLQNTQHQITIAFLDEATHKVVSTSISAKLMKGGNMISEKSGSAGVLTLSSEVTGRFSVEIKAAGYLAIPNLEVFLEAKDQNLEVNFLRQKITALKIQPDTISIEFLSTKKAQLFGVCADGTLILWDLHISPNWTSDSQNLFSVDKAGVVESKLETGTGSLSVSVASLNLSTKIPVKIIQPIGLKNFSFELPLIPNHSYNPLETEWFFSSGSGIQHNGSAFTPTDAPNGVQTAFLQNNISAISQKVYLEAGTFKITFSAAQRGANKQTIIVYFDDIEISSVTPTSSVFTNFESKELTLSRGFHILKFEGNASTGDHTAFLDNIIINTIQKK